MVKITSFKTVLLFKVKDVNLFLDLLWEIRNCTKSPPQSPITIPINILIIFIFKDNIILILVENFNFV